MELFVVPLVAMEGYSSRFTIFIGGTPSTNDANMVAIGK